MAPVALASQRVQRVRELSPVLPVVVRARQIRQLVERAVTNAPRRAAFLSSGVGKTGGNRDGGELLGAHAVGLGNDRGGWRDLVSRVLASYWHLYSHVDTWSTSPSAASSIPFRTL